MSQHRSQNEILNFYQRHKRMPSYSEIMDLLGYSSKNAAYKLVQKLIAAGILEKDEKGKLLPKRMIGEVPVLGLVEAGVPSVAEQDMLDTVSIENFLIQDKENSFMLEVKGDSMIEAHIDEGDYVIAERSEHAKDGDIVVAEVDGEWTLKYFKQQGGKTFLRPGNKNYVDIYPEGSLRVAAIVRGVVRKY